MSKSLMIGRLLGVLQCHDKTHEFIHAAVRAYTGDLLLIGRRSLSPREKWDCMEALRDGLYLHLMEIASVTGVDVAGFPNHLEQGGDHAANKG